MQTDHDKIVQSIERKMAGPSMYKSEEQKKQQIFQYGNEQQDMYNFQGHQNTQRYKIKAMISLSQAQKSLEQIYNYYVNSYIQPRKHFQTFDAVNQRRLSFQPFILFMKNFRLLKFIFPLEKVKLYFKKYANFGQYLTCQNFIFLMNELSHQSQAKIFFNIQQIRQKENVDVESLQQIERQQMFNYLNLQSPQKFRLNFKNVFEPFFCNSKIETKKIKYTYRKFSQPQLLKKSYPKHQNKTQQKQLYVVKNKDVQIQENPFSQVKSIFVSWESLRSKSLANVQKNSTDIVKKKYVKDDPDDDDYLREFGDKHQQQKKRLQKKINEITKEQAKKNKMILAKIEQRTAPKSLVLSTKPK